MQNEFRDVPGGLTDRIAQAIGDPGSVVGPRRSPGYRTDSPHHADTYESVTRWSTRAVLAVLTQAGECGCPGGYDLTPEPYRYVVQHTEACETKRRAEAGALVQSPVT